MCIAEFSKCTNTFLKCWWILFSTYAHRIIYKFLFSPSCFNLLTILLYGIMFLFHDYNIISKFFSSVSASPNFYFSVCFDLWMLEISIEVKWFLCEHIPVWGSERKVRGIILFDVKEKGCWLLGFFQGVWPAAWHSSRGRGSISKLNHEKVFPRTIHFSREEYSSLLPGMGHA